MFIFIAGEGMPFRKAGVFPENMAAFPAAVSIVFLPFLPGDFSFVMHSSQPEKPALSGPSFLSGT